METKIKRIRDKDSSAREWQRTRQRDEWQVQVPAALVICGKRTIIK